LNVISWDDYGIYSLVIHCGDCVDITNQAMAYFSDTFRLWMVAKSCTTWEMVTG